MTQGVPGFTASGLDLVSLGGGQTFGDSTGNLEDAIRVVLNGKDVVVAESWEVRQSILTQPSSFTIRLGWGAVLAGLIPLVQPNTPFQLFVGTTPRFTGQIDGFEAVSDGQSGGSITVHGRDNLAPLHDAFIEKEQSFSDATYYDMVVAAIADVSKTYTVFSNNDANRKLTTGIGVKPTAPSSDSADPNPTAPKAKQLKTKIGERLYEFLKRELDRAGLFLWAAGDGSLVLAQPNGHQPPIARILRQRGLTRNAVSAVSARFKNDTAMRYSEATVYGRGGGKKFGRSKMSGSFVDDEMTGYGFSRPLVLRDANVSNSEQAEFYARRKLAETRRAGWQLVYTMAGSTCPSLLDGSRMAWAPDTVLDVQDDELNLHDTYYCEQVVFRRNPQTVTEITLMKKSDLIFAQGETGS